MKTPHIQTAIKSLELQKKKYSDRIVTVRAGIAVQNAHIVELEEAIKSIDDSIKQLGGVSTTEAVPA